MKTKCKSCIVFATLTMLLFLPSMVQAQEPAVRQTEGTELYQITMGDITMAIDAAHGAKIRSFKLGDKEVISQSTWPETFGSTFWTSPQKEWNWPPVPEYDKKPYEVQNVEGQLIMTSQVSERLGYRIRKSFSTDPADSAFIVTYTIINESSEPRKVAPWEITRVPNAGIIFFDAPVDSIWPSGLLNFSSQHGAAWYQPDAAPQNRKVNADGKGWLAYSNDGLLLIKRFQDIEPAQPAPGEAEIQVYVNRGKTYIELESQGAYTLLQPGEQLNWTVRWYLTPCPTDPSPSSSLLERVR